MRSRRFRLRGELRAKSLRPYRRSDVEPLLFCRIANGARFRGCRAQAGQNGIRRRASGGQLRDRKIPLNAPSGYWDGNTKFVRRTASIAENRRKWVTVFEAGFNDFARESLSDFDGFGDGAAFRDQTWDIGTGSQITGIPEFLNADANSCFFNMSEMFLALHWRLENGV